MTKYRLFAAAAWGSLAGAFLLGSLPADAQDPGRGRAWGRELHDESRAGGGQRSERREVHAVSETAPQAQARGSVGTGWGGRRGGDNGGGRDWAAQRQARDSAAQQQHQRGSWGQRDDARVRGTATAGWQGNRPGADVRTDAGTSGWQRDRSYGANARTREWQRDQRQDGWRAERRDDARNYTRGYRDGRRDDNRWDNRYGQNQHRWDSRGWRSDNRYDWYRYRASNRSLFSLGRYYAPYRGYSYSRISIGFRLGSPFYSNRYWINDPWQYRLPAAYGPYRWVRYYDDALLVDVYSGEVVDAIHNFFW